MGTQITTLMLERCAQTIEQVVIPNLPEGFALEQAMSIARVLHFLAPVVEEKCQELREENEAMREVLGRVLEVLRGEKALSGNAVSNELIRRLDHELKKVEVGPPDAGEENHNLKGALVETINGLDALKEGLPTETMSSLRQQIRSVIRQQLDHGTARAAPWWPPPERSA
jgi:hypothetical protein